MIKYLVVLLVGCGIGYTYGYMQGDAGDESVIDATLVRAHVRHPSADALARRATADSVAAAAAPRR